MDIELFGAMYLRQEKVHSISQWLATRLLVIAAVLLTITPLHAAQTKNSNDSARLIQRLLETFKTPAASADVIYITDTLQVSGCEDYPYHNNEQELSAGINRLVDDLRAGLQKGLMCLTGNSEIGDLHPYHHKQALRLIYTLENKQPKSLQCVRDELFAYAMAASSQQQISDIELAEKLRNSPDLTILLDTYRIGGLLSQKFTPETYVRFFKLNQDEITQHLTGKPMRMKGVQRYENLPGLLFHEMVHWLGHLHTNIDPDITFLYETCCFGGSEYINDDQVNASFQAKACNILKDKELWESHPYQKMRLWKHKDYDQLKREMREYY